MKITEMISALDKIREEHGDLECVDPVYLESIKWFKITSVTEVPGIENESGCDFLVCEIL